MFNVEDIQDVAWNDDAFEKLVLPNNSKELAWTFVENKSLDKNSFDDFVESKGGYLPNLISAESDVC